jgi:ATP-dependent DNA helicase RecG
VTLPPFQQYYVDYREKLSDDPEIRWTDRLAPDGTWVANLFQFSQLVIQRLTSGLRVPFQLAPDLFRVDDTIIHQALREALTNALIHADYQGIGGIIIERFRSRIEMSNPGSLLISYEQLLHGGVSECRNRNLQQMFQMIGRGERAGSGIDKILQGWKAQQWRLPEIEERFQPDRVHIILPMESLLPEESVERLHRVFGKRFDALGPVERQTLVTADIEGQVSNARMRMVSDAHTADLTRMLQGLVSKGFLEQLGQKRGTFYRLRRPLRAEDISHNTPVSPHTGSSPHNEIDSPHKEGGLTEAEEAILMEIAAPAQKTRRLAPEETRRIIMELCTGRYLTAAQIGAIMDRRPDLLRERFLGPMVREGLLALRYPHELTRPNQAYTARTY